MKFKKSLLFSTKALVEKKLFNLHKKWLLIDHLMMEREVLKYIAVDRFGGGVMAANSLFPF